MIGKGWRRRGEFMATPWIKRVAALLTTFSPEAHFFAAPMV
jgi:hypothetical protein